MKPLIAIALSGGANPLSFRIFSGQSDMTYFISFPKKGEIYRNAEIADRHIIF